MEKWIAGITGTVGFLVSYLVDGVGMAVSILLAVMALDYATGLIAAFVNKQLNSRIGTTGFARKLYILLLIAAVYLVESILFGSEHVGDGIAIAYIAIEFISITENGVKMGAPMPPFVSDLLSMVKSKTEGKEN
ncbi:phage holin family protein [Viridibacillus sp. YIM B01967]|uniref:Phage holin family protein n=1 Tax=Viridibacillus soli TaxID=2798301 RepID=A0ABS1H7E9_9BACL|nr:phage holin family protein [Viridibacillus soli]MBK3495331.1 phage holin family protein [Viridibacillus soli]